MWIVWLAANMLVPDAGIFDQKALMQVYDHNQYQSTARAHRDAFYADSVNGSHNLKGR